MYDTNNPRYAHLAGLTEEEIQQVMFIADYCVGKIKEMREEANREKKRKETKEGRENELRSNHHGKTGRRKNVSTGKGFCSGCFCRSCKKGKF